MQTSADVRGGKQISGQDPGQGHDTEAAGASSKKLPTGNEHRVGEIGWDGIHKMEGFSHLFQTVASRFMIVWETDVMAASSIGSTAGSLFRSPTAISLEARSVSCLN